MKKTYLTITIFTTMVLSGCTTRYEAYLRNLTNETALVDVFLLDKRYKQQVPEKVKVARAVVPVKSGMKEKLNDRQTVLVKDSAHFIFELKPQTTADLTDMAGEIWNGSWLNNVRVVVITGSRTDTLMNGYGYFNKKMFTLYEKGFSDPIYYYDVK